MIHQTASYSSNAKKCFRCSGDSVIKAQARSHSALDGQCPVIAKRLINRPGFYLA